MERICLRAGWIIDAFWVQFFPSLWQVIHYCEATHLHYQLPLGLLANGTQIERRSWKAESCEVFSDPSCNAFTWQLPLILCTQPLCMRWNTKLHVGSFCSFLWGFMALNLFSSCSALFPRNCCSQWGRKNGPCSKHEDFFIPILLHVYLFSFDNALSFPFIQSMQQLALVNPMDLSRE